MYEYLTTRRIEFSDTDMAGIVHFARFFVFMEVAEHEMLRAAGAPEAHFEYEGERIGWPRGAASCVYHSPARLGDVLDIRLRIKRKGKRSITYAALFKIADRVVAEGEISSICCSLGSGQAEPLKLRAVLIPKFLNEQLEVAPD